jgi:hypothetical protein
LRAARPAFQRQFEPAHSRRRLTFGKETQRLLPPCALAVRAQD